MELALDTLTSGKFRQTAFADHREAKKMIGMRSFLKNVIPFFIAALMCLLQCVSSPAATVDNSVELRVDKGDDLIHLCRKYLEKPQKWHEVAKFNRMKNPDLILPGQILKIPVRLMPRVPVDGIVTFVHGNARVQKVEKTEWVKLNLGDMVAQGSKLQTGKTSSVEVTFENRNSILMRSNTTLGLTTSEKRGSFYSIGSFYLSIGRVVTKFKEATGSDSRMEIETPSAIASVRGTEFRVSADEKESMRTEVLTGTVKVSGMEKTVQLHEGEGTFVQKGTPPIPPRKLLSPLKLADFKTIYKELPLRFIYEEMAGLYFVRGVLAKDAEGRTVVDEKVVGRKEPLEFINVPDGTYYLLSQGIDDLGIEGFQSQPYEVKLRANPFPPLVELRGDEAEFVGKTAQFKWLKVSDAVMYHVQIAQDRAFTDIKEEKADYRGESYSTGPLDYGNYYLRISSIAADGYEAGWSPVVPFRLIPPPPAPALEKPAVSEKEIYLKWRNLGEGITYHFQMAKDENFREILVDRKTDKSETILEKPKKPGTYYVRTSSIDARNREGGFSAAQSFKVERRFPYGATGGILAVIGLVLLLAK